MQEILINDLINNIGGYKLLFNPKEHKLLSLNNYNNIEDLIDTYISSIEEKAIIFLLDKWRTYIICFVFDEEDNDIVTYENKKPFKDDDDIIDNINEFITNILDDYKPTVIGIIQETKDNKYKSLKAIEDSTDEEFWNALLSKDIRCRYCQELMVKANSFSCKNGDGYREQD